MRDQAPTKDARSKDGPRTDRWILALYGFLGSLPSHAERPERLRLIGAVPHGFEQTQQLHFTHFKVDEYTASASHALCSEHPHTLGTASRILAALIWLAR